MRFKNTLFLFLSLSLIVACGGGGGGGGSSSPSIGVTLSASDNAISVGESVTITWSSSNSTSCSASGAWSGSKSTSGSETVSFDSSGTKSFSLSCSGSGSSGSANTSVNVGYPIAIGKLINSDSSDVELFIDTNSDFIKNDNEKSVTTSSDGSYELRSNSQSEADCLKKYPIVSLDGSKFSMDINYSSDKNITPFTSILSDVYGNDYDSFIGYENSDSNCGALNSYMLERTNMYLKYVIFPRIETYDGFEILDLYKQITIDTQRNDDIIKFQTSAQSIADTMKSELDDAISGLGYSNSEVIAHSELDTSSYRIFLNTSSYPNPSTDTSPAATSIDNVATKAGVRIRASIPSSDFMPGWDLEAIYDTWDVKISNNGEILSDISGCYLNFSNLCKQPASLLNGISYGQFDLFEIYHKDTTRGKEKIYKEEKVIDAETGYCQEWDNQQISSEHSDRFLIQRIREYRGNGYFSDLDCPTYDAAGRGYQHIELFPNGTSFFVEVWDNYGTYIPSNTEIIIDNYDDTDPLPDQIPQDSVDAMILFGGVYNNSSALENLSTDPNPFNIFLAMYYGDLLGISDYQVLPTLNRNVEFYMQTNYIDNKPGYMFVEFDTYAITCRTPTQSIDSSFYDSDHVDKLNLCINSLLDKDTVTEANDVRNNSPYRGIIDE